MYVVYVYAFSRYMYFYVCCFVCKGSHDYALRTLSLWQISLRGQ